MNTRQMTKGGTYIIHTYVLYYNDDRPHQNTRVNMIIKQLQLIRLSDTVVAV